MACAGPRNAESETKAAEQFVLPDGAAKQTIETICVGCHDLRRVVHSNYSPDEWHNVVNMMVSAGAPLSPAQKEAVIDYLVANFPGKPKPAPVIIAGPVDVSFHEWQVPTLGSRPHDPLATPDGAIWYTGQMANKLGRLDPSTGAFKEYPLKTPFSGPHGLTEDKDGDIWFTANFAGYVGKLDPRTGDVTEYKMPDPRHAIRTRRCSTRTACSGSPCRTANMVGRLDPKTGEIKLVTCRRRARNPTAWCSLGRRHHLLRHVRHEQDRQHRSQHDGDQGIRVAGCRQPAAPHRHHRDDIIWYADYSRGHLGRLDPKTGKVTRISFSGWTADPALRHHRAQRRHLVRRIGLQPNALVRFDPKTERFQTWTIPSGGGVVRNMMPTPDGHTSRSLAAR